MSAVVFYVIFIFIIIHKLKNGNKKDTRIVSSKPPVSKARIGGIQNKISHVPADEVFSSAERYSMKKKNIDDLICQFENRHGDWLSCQIRDENRSVLQISDMLDLKYSHMLNCDAENLRREHSLHCDVHEIDTGLMKGRY